MSKKVVRYNNDLNSITFGSFREKELDLFFSICFKLKELGTDEVEITFEELKELSDYSNRNVKRFIKDLESTYDKMLGLNIKMKHSELSFEKFNLFTTYSVHGDTPSDYSLGCIQVNEVKILSYKHDVISWIERCIKEVAVVPSLREM